MYQMRDARVHILALYHRQILDDRVCLAVREHDLWGYSTLQLFKGHCQLGPLP